MNENENFVYIARLEEANRDSEELLRITMNSARDGGPGKVVVGAKVWMIRKLYKFTFEGFIESLLKARQFW